MKTIFRLSFVFLLIFLLSCKDDENNPEGEYFPLSIGNSWKYTGPYPFTATVTDQEKIFNDVAFKEVQIKAGTTIRSGYIRREGGDYYSRGFLNNMNSQLTATEEHEIIILKEKVDVNATWSHTLQINNRNYNYKFTLVSKNGSKTLDDQQTFNNVIQVQLTVIPEGGTTPGSLHDLFFAKGIGLVAIKVQYTGETVVETYNVK